MACAGAGAWGHRIVIRRTLDPTILNEIANHPEVLPWTGAKGAVDLTNLIANTNNYALVVEGGGFLLIQSEPGIYEVHSLFLPEARSQSLRAARDGFDYMFTRTNCERIVSQVPDNNPAASGLARLVRFRPMFRREDTPRGPTAFVGLTIEEWAQDSKSLERDGEWFHERLEQAKSGSELPTHPHDPAHDRAVGATVRMIRAGNIVKGVSFYNRWARFAGYAQISIVSENTIDVVDAVVEWRDNEMEVLLCR